MQFTILSVSSIFHCHDLPILHFSLCAMEEADCPGYSHFLQGSSARGYVLVRSQKSSRWDLGALVLSGLAYLGGKQILEFVEVYGD